MEHWLEQMEALSTLTRLAIALDAPGNDVFLSMDMEKQEARLQAAFPAGVCEWSKPGVGFTRNVSWLSFTKGPGGHALGPAVRVQTPDKGTRHLFPLGWVYRRADGGDAESIAGKLHRELGYPDPTGLGRFTDTGERA